MKNITVTCPECREVLEIDTASGKVIKHHPEVKPKPGADFMAERMKSLKEEKAKRAQLVAGSREREMKKSERADELFQKVKEQTKEGPPADRPLRDVDID